MRESQKPRVSVGMPVFNGEAHIDQAIRAILDQTYTNIELVICDNASTDRTAEICTRYAGLDSRIRYHRNDENIGAAPNFNLAFRLSSGTYFRWAAHDDLIAPTFLESCVDCLERARDAVLCHSRVRFIDSSGSEIGAYDIDLPHTGLADPAARFRELLLVDHLCIEVFGVIRSRVLADTPLIASYIASDRVLLAELGLRGRFLKIPEPLFLSRDHEDRSIRSIPYQFRAAWFDPRKAPERAFPHWRILREYWKCIGRVPMTGRDRARCYAQLGRWLTVNANWARMISDVVIGIEPRSIEKMYQIRDRYFRK